MSIKSEVELSADSMTKLSSELDLFSILKFLKKAFKRSNLLVSLLEPVIFIFPLQICVSCEILRSIF